MIRYAPMLFAVGVLLMGKTPLQARQVGALRFLGGPQTHCMLEGGSGSGKTFVGLNALILRALMAPGSRHALFRYRFNHAKLSVWKGTLPDVINKRWPEIASLVQWNHSDHYITLPGGSEIWIGGLDDKTRVDKVLGQDHATLYFNECSQMSYDAITTALTRLRQLVEIQDNGEPTGRMLRPKAYYDQNPPSTRHWTHTLFHRGQDPEDRTTLPEPEDYDTFQMHPRDNVDNLAAGYLKSLERLPVRKRKRFWDGEYGSDVEGALWTGDTLAATRLPERPRFLERIVVGVDPAVTSKDTSDETGIITAGMKAGHIYVWRDDTCKATPLGWANASLSAYDEEEADLVIGEANNGGDLVESNLRQVDRHVSYKKVMASRGKYIRAEPVANLWEQGIAHVCGEMPDLEDELVSWSPSGDEPSPNRLDALVWAVTELVGKKKLAGAWPKAGEKGDADTTAAAGGGAAKKGGTFGRSSKRGRQTKPWSIKAVRG